MLRYPVKITHEDGAVVVTFPNFPAVQTFGDDEPEALARAVDALETMLMGMIEDHKEIPPSAARRGRFITLPALIEAKVELYRRVGSG